MADRRQRDGGTREHAWETDAMPTPADSPGKPAQLSFTHAESG